MEWGIQILFKWTLDEFLEQHSKVIVLFYSDTCNKCHFRMNNLVDLAWERDEDWDPFVVAYNAWEDLELCSKLNLITVPMLIAFENGEEIWRMDEVQTNDFIKNYFWNEWEWDNLSVRVEIKQEETWDILEQKKEETDWNETREEV